MLGVAPGTVKSRLARARKKFGGGAFVDGVRTAVGGLAAGRRRGGRRWGVVVFALFSALHALSVGTRPVQRPLGGALEVTVEGSTHGGYASSDHTEIGGVLRGPRTTRVVVQTDDGTTHLALTGYDSFLVFIPGDAKVEHTTGYDAHGTPLRAWCVDADTPGI